jgi:hypothetical protein
MSRSLGAFLSKMADLCWHFNRARQFQPIRMRRCNPVTSGAAEPKGGRSIDKLVKQPKPQGTQWPVDLLRAHEVSRALPLAEMLAPAPMGMPRVNLPQVERALGQLPLILPRPCSRAGATPGAFAIAAALMSS